MKTIAVYDPTATDQQSRVRGIGRYFQTLKETFNSISTPHPVGNVNPSLYQEQPANPSDNLYFNYLSELKSLRPEMIFLNPFFNPVQKPLFSGKKTHKQLAVIHDLIPLKYKKNYPTGLRGWWYNFLNKRAIKKYDLIITDSEVSKKDIVTLYKVPAEKVRVIYPTVSRLFLPHLDTSEESPAHHHPFHKENNQIIPEFSRLPLDQITKNELLKNLKDFAIYVGDATWNKNLPNLARALKMTNITCVFVGNVFSEANVKQLSVKPHPWQKSLYEFLQLAQNDKRFIFPGFISDLELLLLYSNARMNLLMSYDEGFGYSFAEAGYMSTPSVLADIPIFREIAGEAAVFANPQDPKDIAQKMSELFYDKVRHEKLSIRAFDRAQSYNPSRFQKEWLGLLQII
ncbi:glycosyltransferase family 4 protein [Candidatus Roizmanbacteria bacterium]|nr:MAG: glycosyltransferase family 4 protein [Candidatus Roizmanbacteria bacterium]